MLSIIRSEAAFIVGAVTTAILFTVGAGWFDDLSNTPKLAGLFLWVFAAMVWCAFAVVRHADSLAELLGEPYGTLILTISVIGIEVAVISALMLTGKAEPTLARDTMLAVVIIVLNGMVGLSLLIGGLRHREQDYNLQGARAFLGVLVTLATVSLILPRFTISTADRQPDHGAGDHLRGDHAGPLRTSSRCRPRATGPISTSRRTPTRDGGTGRTHGKHARSRDVRSVPYHAVLLVLTLLPDRSPVEEAGDPDRLRPRRHSTCRRRSAACWWRSSS